MGINHKSYPRPAVLGGGGIGRGPCLRGSEGCGQCLSEAFEPEGVPSQSGALRVKLSVANSPAMVA